MDATGHQKWDGLGIPVGNDRTVSTISEFAEGDQNSRSCQEGRRRQEYGERRSEDLERKQDPQPKEQHAEDLLRSVPW